MSHTASGKKRNINWYNHNVFPLVPILEIKKANEHNTSGFSFRWLFFTFWTLDSIEFELTFTISKHWGFGVIGMLPYLRWCITIPCPEWVGIKIDSIFSRSF